MEDFTSFSPKEEKIPSVQEDKPAGHCDWFFNTTDDLYDGPYERQEAIDRGREYHDEGEPFEIGRGSFSGPGSCLFYSVDRLADWIDDNNEDESHEEGFCVEAGLGEADLEPLLSDINTLWTAFVAKHNPTSRLLHFSVREDVPGTPEWEQAEASRALGEQA